MLFVYYRILYVSHHWLRMPRNILLDMHPVANTPRGRAKSSKQLRQCSLRHRSGKGWNTKDVTPWTQNCAECIHGFDGGQSPSGLAGLKPRSWEVHQHDCISAFNKPFKIHKWLQELACPPPWQIANVRLRRAIPKLPTLTRNHKPCVLLSKWDLRTNEKQQWVSAPTRATYLFTYMYVCIYISYIYTYIIYHIHIWYIYISYNIYM